MYIFVLIIFTVLFFSFIVHTFRFSLGISLALPVAIMYLFDATILKVEFGVHIVTLCDGQMGLRLYSF